MGMDGDIRNEMRKYGPFGKYNGAEIVSNAKRIFTGSALGASAFMISGSTFAGGVTSSDGTIISSNTFAQIGLSGSADTPQPGCTPIIELSIAGCTSAAATEHIIVLKK